MFKISGECIFVTEGQLGNGMKMADDLRKKGFEVTPLFIVSATPKQYRFTFECCSGEDSPSALIL